MKPKLYVFSAVFLGWTFFAPNAKAVSKPAPAMATVYNCSQALEDLDKYRELLNGEETGADPIKKLAEILILKAPILLNNGHLKAVQETPSKKFYYYFSIFTPEEKATYIHDVWESIKAPFTPYFGKTSPAEFSDSSKSDLLKAAYTANLTVNEFLKVSQIVKAISDSPELQDMTLQLLEQAMPLFSTRGGLPDAAARRKFYEDISSDSRQFTPINKVEVEDLVKGNITLKHHYENGIVRVETFPLFKFVTQDFPILYGQAFDSAMEGTLSKFGINSADFLKTFKKYSNEELATFSDSVWSSIFLRFSMAVPAETSFKSWSEAQRTELTSQARAVGLVDEKFLLAARYVKALDESPQTRTAMVEMIKATLLNFTKSSVVDSSSNRYAYSDREDRDTKRTGWASLLGLGASAATGIFLAPHLGPHAAQILSTGAIVTAVPSGIMGLISGITLLSEETLPFKGIYEKVDNLRVKWANWRLKKKAAQVSKKDFGRPRDNQSEGGE